MSYDLVFMRLLYNIYAQEMTNMLNLRIQMNNGTISKVLGIRQVVRHWVLVPAFGGSNPSSPAKEIILYLLVMCRIISLV